jgi:hypothetical protein
MNGVTYSVTVVKEKQAGCHVSQGNMFVASDQCQSKMVGILQKTQLSSRPPDVAILLTAVPFYQHDQSLSCHVLFYSVD